MATDKYSKQTTIRLTEAEHEALGAEAERRGRSLSRYLAAAGLAAIADGEALKAAARRERARAASRAARQSSEREALVAIHGQLRRAATQLRGLRQQFRSEADASEADASGADASEADAVEADAAALLGEIEEATERLLASL